MEEIKIRNISSIINIIDAITDVMIAFLEIERLWWPERRIRTVTKKKNRRDQDLRVYRDI